MFGKIRKLLSKNYYKQEFVYGYDIQLTNEQLKELETFLLTFDDNYNKNMENGKYYEVRIYEYVEDYPKHD